MIKRLNIVNGDACISMMKKAEIEGDFLPWGDFLHEGPVFNYLSLEKLSKLRAQFISNYGLGDFNEIYKEFEQRDKKLNLYHNYEKVVLWFEHDLYDQLQLLQILAWFSDKNLGKTKLSLICTSNYLGDSSAQQIKKLLNYETTILEEHLTLAKKSWSAFCYKTPIRWAELLNEPTALLPFLQSAIYRMLEEFPNTKNGLSRTEHQALLVISNGIDNPMDIFIKCQTFEERKFMGDIIFWKILENFENHQVIKREEKKLLITPLGKQLLNAEENWLNIKPIQRYIGGVHLTLDNIWCWDVQNKTIKPYYYSKALNAFLRIK